MSSNFIKNADYYANMIFNIYNKELCESYNKSRQSTEELEIQYAIIRLEYLINKYLGQHNVPDNLKKEVRSIIKSMLDDPQYNKPTTNNLNNDDLSR